ncbi:MAG: hypothetical protein AAGD14_15605 [Planctomycetota bacterium]
MRSFSISWQKRQPRPRVSSKSAAHARRTWPKFSVFDCYACHHPIYQDTVYEWRKAPGKPGALPLAAVDVDRARANLLLRFGHEMIRTAPRRLMQQLVFAVDVLAPTRDGDAYRSAYAELRASVDPTRAYDAARSARLGLKALAAGGYPR